MDPIIEFAGSTIQQTTDQLELAQIHAPTPSDGASQAPLKVGDRVRVKKFVFDDALYTERNKPGFHYLIYDDGEKRRKTRFEPEWVWEVKE